jgi:hypothetical protein
MWYREKSKGIPGFLLAEMGVRSLFIGVVLEFAVELEFVVVFCFGVVKFDCCIGIFDLLVLLVLPGLELAALVLLAMLWLIFYIKI